MAASEGVVGRFKAAAIPVPSFVDRMNEKEKMRLYNKYNCSEVNVFIYSSRGLTKNARKSISCHFSPFSAWSPR